MTYVDQRSTPMRPSPDRITAPVVGSRDVVGGVRRADQAARHRAAAADDRAGDVLRRSAASRRSGWWSRPSSAARCRPARASALNCVYDRDIDEQMRRTRRRALPRHIVIAAGGAGLRRWCSACSSTVVLGVWVNWLSAVLALRGRARSTFRLHDAAQAAYHPEHRVGRPGRLLPGADRLDRRHRRAGLGAGRAVPRRLLLDAAAHLGAGAALPRGLRRRRRADAAGGRAGRRGRPPDRRLQLGDGRDLAAAVAGRRHRPGLPGRGRRAGRGFLVEAHRMWRRAPRHRGPRR